jgi:endonuclease/exonuclease/phosphatase family metal-dependent hydrolase
VGYYRGVECSVMSRFEITDAKVWLNHSLDGVRREGPGWSPVPPGAKMSFQRSPIMVNVRISKDYELTLFALHHKAGADFDYQRESEAVRITELINEVRSANPARNIIVLGDFNAGPFDKSYRVYLEAGMIDTLAHRLWQGDNPETALYKTHESNRVLDYILLNSAAHREMVIGSAFVLGTLSPPASYNFRTDPHPPGYASDHYPVAVEIMPKDLR